MINAEFPPSFRPKYFGIALHAAKYIIIENKNILIILQVWGGNYARKIVTKKNWTNFDNWKTNYFKNMQISNRKLRKSISLKSTFICKNIYLLTKMLCYVKNILRTKVIVNAKYLKESRALVVKTPKCISFDNSYLIEFDQIVCSDWEKQQWKIVNICMNWEYFVQVGRLEALCSSIEALKYIFFTMKIYKKSLESFDKGLQTNCQK